MDSWNTVNTGTRTLLARSGYNQIGQLRQKHYYLHDHLGNVRSVLTPSGSAFASIQQQDYYPYGLRKALAGAGENPYLYNGKELQGELGGQYDYGARMLDPVIGRWNVPDPLAEMYYSSSPYNYVDNNPISRFDPDGRSYATRYVDKYGRTLLNTDDGRDDVVIVPSARIDEFEENAHWNHRLLDSDGWNDHWRAEFGIAITQDELYKIGYYGLSTEKSQEASIEYLFGSRTFQSFVWEEVKGQWGNPVLVTTGLLAGAHGSVAAYQGMIFKRYSPRVRARGVEDPVSHNFPYIYDDAILSTRPQIKNNGYKIYQKAGVMNGKQGVFEIGVDKNGVIDHRFFRPTK